MILATRTQTRIAKALLPTTLPTLIPKLDASPDADLDADTGVHSDASGVQEQDDVFNWQQAFQTMA